MSLRWILLLTLVGCKKPADDVVTPSATLSVDPVYGVANVDDDDENGEPDWDDVGAASDNDLAPITWSSEEDVDLTFAGADVRVWSGGAVILDADVTTANVPAGTTLEVEFAESMADATLTFTPVDTVDAAVTIPLRASPLILNNHLQPAEMVLALEITRQGNEAFIDGFTSVLGDAFLPVEGTRYGYDVWVQDEIELGTMTAPGHRMDVVIDSIRTTGDQYLDPLAERVFEAPDFARRGWGSGRATSQDSFGNMEVSPPVTVDGVEYPFGRIYWGRTASWGPTEALTEMLDAQKVQAPFQLDIRWLCVGHVDEFSSFVPDPTSPKGFRLLYTDTTLAKTFLEGLDPDMAIPQFVRTHGYSTVGELVEDDALWDYNADLQADYLDPNLETFKTELGLDEEDIIRIPGMFEESRECAGGALSLIPGTANLVIAEMDGVTNAFIADPFLREDVDDQASDPFIAEVASLIPSNLTIRWLDDWDWYHAAWGEVHCGSNTERTPVADWWTVALHLLEEE